MYPFEADMAELQKEYGEPDQDILETMAERIKCAITDTNYRHKKDYVRETLLYMAAAMLIGKIKNPALASIFVEHNMRMYAHETYNIDRDDNDYTTKKHSLISMANKRYGLGIGLLEDEHEDISEDTAEYMPENEPEPQYCISIQGYLRCIPKGDIWDLSKQDLSDGIVKLPFKVITRLASYIIEKELTEKFQKASYNDEIDGNILRIITDELGKHGQTYSNTSSAIPPCMLHCRQVMEGGEHLTYNGRFTLAAYHGKRGMSQDDIAVMFENAPDYKEGVTRMHINNILKKELMPYSCEKMEQYGLCKRHERCGMIKNPLSYK